MLASPQSTHGTTKVPRPPVSGKIFAFTLSLRKTLSAVSLEAVLDALRSCGKSLPEDASATRHALVNKLAVVGCSRAE
jgi:hypothetical protein